VKTIWEGRATRAAARYGEHAPMVGVCCNVCRTCTTTNLASLALAGIAGAGIAVAAFARRLAGKPA
jgi:hypothetical protein